MVVASCIDGRMRVRDCRLRDGEVATAVKGALEGIPGVLSIAVSERVGSLLVTFEEGLARGQAILGALREILGGEAEEKPAHASPKQMASRRRTKTRTMLAALLMLALAAVIDMEKLHIGAGLVFLSFVIDHLRERWGMLFPRQPPLRAAHA